MNSPSQTHRLPYICEVVVLCFIVYEISNGKARSGSKNLGKRSTKSNGELERHMLYDINNATLVVYWHQNPIDKR